MLSILVTLDTCHFEMSLLNNFAPSKISVMSCTRDTSHSPIGPYGPVEQSPFGDTSRHERTARSTSSLDWGENADLVAGLSVHSFDDMEPDEPKNKPSLLASRFRHQELLRLGVLFDRSVLFNRSILFNIKQLQREYKELITKLKNRKMDPMFNLSKTWQNNDIVGIYCGYKSSYLITDNTDNTNNSR